LIQIVDDTVFGMIVIHKFGGVFLFRYTPNLGEGGERGQEV
jgi:hypothetical protein